MSHFHFVQAMGETEALEMKAALESKGEVEFKVCTLGKDVTIKKSMVSINIEKKKEHQRKFTPSVIEPSFGIGRIIYCLFEHCFYQRPGKAEDEQLNVFGFTPLVAPIKCTVFPLVKLEKFEVVAKKISKALTAAGISHIIDMTGTRPNFMDLRLFSIQHLYLSSTVVFLLFFASYYTFNNEIDK